MESFKQTELIEDINYLKETARQIADMYIYAANKYLEDGDPFKTRIINYYSERQETEEDLLNFLGKKNEDERTDYIQNIKSFTEDSSRFIEQMEKMYELQDVHKRRRELDLQDRIATDVEYELGAYTDVIESQVKDAVVAAQKKGYLTFQSGFVEKNERDQFIDFYNKNIFIPEETLRYLREQFIDVDIENFDDRTTLVLHPTGNDPIRLTKWKEIWDAIIESLPQADPETVSNVKLTREHEDFRIKQDSLKKLFQKHNR